MAPELITENEVRRTSYRRKTPLGVPARPMKQDVRAVVRGKFLFVGDAKFFIRGAHYDPLNSGGADGFDAKDVDLDFASMAELGINTVRTDAPVPPWLLDSAHRHGLRVLIGLAWPQASADLDSKEAIAAIEQSVRQAVRGGKDHPAVLGYSVASEIPAAVVRVFGTRRVERVIKRLFEVSREEDPAALITYVSSTETGSLRLPFLDFFCFNVQPEGPAELSATIARLHNVAEDKPVILGELGLGRIKMREKNEVANLRVHIERAFAGGCAGVCVSAVNAAFGELPFASNIPWPRVSVVVCTYNGARHIRETCEALCNLDYDAYEVIFVLDGCTDGTAAIVSEFDFKVVEVENGGLSRARNLGLQHASGEIIAYLDDDAYPDEHWLKYLAWSFMTTVHAGIGGPNIPPPNDGFWATCVAHSPGGPTHVLLDDGLAEHIPGCNMAFRRSALMHVGGFDRDFRIAGDDVDLCWRIHHNGGTLGFSPAAVVWHHRRGSVSAYLRQQYNYGRAEAMLEAKWPQKFNSAGHVRWGGRIYGSGRATPVFSTRIQLYRHRRRTIAQLSVDDRAGVLGVLTMMPESHLVVGILALTSVLGLLWSPLSYAAFLFVPALLAQIAQSVRGAVEASIPQGQLKDEERWRAKVMIAALHYLQGLTRLRGRLVEGLSPWRLGLMPISLPGLQAPEFFEEKWMSRECTLEALENRLRQVGVTTFRRQGFGTWNLEVEGGIAGCAKALVAMDSEKRNSRRTVRYRVEPRFSGMTRMLLFGLLAWVLMLSMMGADREVLLLSTSGVLLGLFSLIQSNDAAAMIHRAIEVASGVEA
ncbi:MAG: glycosyltransferase [Gemmatimonadales bacterium]